MQISVTGLCNLRCKYCMLAVGIIIVKKSHHDEMISVEEIVDAVRELQHLWAS